MSSHSFYSSGAFTHQLEFSSDKLSIELVPVGGGKAVATLNLTTQTHGLTISGTNIQFGGAHSGSEFPATFTCDIKENEEGDLASTLDIKIEKNKDFTTQNPLFDIIVVEDCAWARAVPSPAGETKTNVSANTTPSPNTFEMGY